MSTRTMKQTEKRESGTTAQPLSVLIDRELLSNMVAVLCYTPVRQQYLKQGDIAWLDKLTNAAWATLNSQTPKTEKR